MLVLEEEGAVADSQADGEAEERVVADSEAERG
jgi:hypothetical protein